MIALAVLPSKTYAQSIVAGLPFGGRIVSVATYPFAFPACPLHTLVIKLNESPIGQPRLMGVFAGPGSKIYQHFNITTPGVWLLGTYSPTVLLPPICPYPVAPIVQVGTGLFPGF